MASPVLVGIETEYGLAIRGRGPGEQVQDSMELVRSVPGEPFVGWDYRFEAPRADLRGFTAASLNFDPEDARWDSGKTLPSDRESRADRVLPNGARFYNDHGHPEYATPECSSLRDLALHDQAGERVVWEAAREFGRKTGRIVSVYKNNTDYHGSSYGTHENLLVPRALGFEALVSSLMPMLVARTLLCGAGKWAEDGAFQLSQRADYFTEVASVDTLYKRPIFNTRDEPHADPKRWMRLHVICGDANLMPCCTARKVGLLLLVLELTQKQECPLWRLADPLAAFQEVSRAVQREARIELDGGTWTTPSHILESYLSAYLRHGENAELLALAQECQGLLDWLRSRRQEFARKVDWACKLQMLQEYQDSEGLPPFDPHLQALDLEYHRIDPEQGLFPALAASGLADQGFREDELAAAQTQPPPGTRAQVRSLAVRTLREDLKSLSWGTLTFQDRTIPLEPHLVYPAPQPGIGRLQDLVEWVEAIHAHPS